MRRMTIALAFAVLTLTVPAPAAAGEAGPVHHRSEATRALGLPFSDAVQVGDVLYISGQLGNLPGRMELAPGGMEGQARQVMDNIGAILAARGLTYDDLFKCTVMMADMSQWGAFNRVYVPYFKPDRLPARSAFGASGLALGGLLEVECQAWSPAGR